MSNIKRTGIYMDHSNAHIMEFTADPIQTKTLESDFTNVVKGATLNKSESVMHNTEQHDLANYYKHLGAVIKNYDEVVLFGPTEAKVELFNILRADHNFGKIEIKVHKSDKMNEHEQHTFVREYFSKHAKAPELA